MRLSVPSCGAMPLQFNRRRADSDRTSTFSPLVWGNASAIPKSQDSLTSSYAFQSPRVGQCLCNVPSGESTLHKSWSFSPLVWGNASAIFQMGAASYQNLSFSPLVWGNASAIRDDDEVIPDPIELSVPSCGAMPLQS